MSFGIGVLLAGLLTNAALAWRIKSGWALLFGSFLTCFGADAAGLVDMNPDRRKPPIADAAPMIQPAFVGPMQAAVSLVGDWVYCEPPVTTADEEPAHRYVRCGTLSLSANGDYREVVRWECVPTADYKDYGFTVTLRGKWSINADHPDVIDFFVDGYTVHEVDGFSPEGVESRAKTFAEPWPLMICSATFEDLRVSRRGRFFDLIPKFVIAKATE